MTLPTLLVSLGRAGVELAPVPGDPERVRYRPAALGADLLAAIVAHRAHLARLIAGYVPPEGERRYVFCERLGVADDLEVPTHPGAPAWSIAVGEALGASETAAGAAGGTWPSEGGGEPVEAPRGVGEQDDAKGGRARACVLGHGNV